MHVPYQWCHSPLEDRARTGVHGIMNLPAVFILLILTALLIRGTQESARVNSIIVVTKVSIVLIVIAIGWGFINPANHTPFIPEATTYTTPQGISIRTAASWAFSAPPASSSSPSSASTPCRRPRRKPRIRSATCRLAFSARWSSARFSTCCSRTCSPAWPPSRISAPSAEASVAFAITKYMPGYEWLSKFVTVAILAGFSSVILVMLLGQSRVFFSMSRDGLVPKVFSEVHPKFQTPYKSNMLFFVFTSAVRRRSCRRASSAR